MLIVPKIIFLFAIIFWAGSWLPFLLSRRAALEPTAFFILSLMSGLQTVYFLTLALPNLAAVISLLTLMAMGGAVVNWSHLKIFFPRKILPRSPWDWISLAIFGLIGVPILSEPIVAWDAWAIWFFHGKIIFLEGGLGSSSALTWPAYADTHPSYPKLYSSVIALFPYLTGVWNEYLPQLAILFFWGLNGMLAWTIGQTPLTRFFYFLLLLPFGRDLLWNGYLDFYLAVYFSIGCLLILRYQSTPSSITLAMAVSLLGLSLNLKNEGLAMIACLALVLLIAKPVLVMRILSTKTFWLTSALPVGNFLLWTFYKRQWQLSGYLDFGTSMLAQISERLNSFDDVAFILTKLLSRHLHGLLFLAGLLLLLPRPRRDVLRFDGLWVFAVPTLYFFLLVVIYLSTPFDLRWHLNTSIDRVVIVLNLLLLLAGAELFQKARQKPG